MASMPAYAQSCDVVYDTIVKLRKPEYGSYNVWDTVHGDVETDEAYVSGVPLPDGSMMVAGTKRLYRGAQPTLTVSMISRRGRVLSEEEHKVEGLDEVVKIVERAGGYLVASNVMTKSRLKKIWLGFMDAEGKLEREIILEEPHSDLGVEDLFVTQDGQLVVAATYLNKEGDAPLSSRVYQLDEKGKVQIFRTYISGEENRIRALIPTERGVFGVGYGFGDDGRKNGWIIRLDANYNIMWQRLYPRGAGSVLNTVKQYQDQFLVVGGTAAPGISSGLRAGWLMVVSTANGAIGWQRFYTEDVHYDVRSILVSDSGVISALIDGVGDKGSEWPNHTRLVTLNPRGVIFSAETFYNGEGANANTMVEDKAGLRVMIGSTLIAHQMEYQGEQSESGDKLEAHKIKKSLEGWILAAPTVPAYDDPCLKVFSPVP